MKPYRFALLLTDDPVQALRIRRFALSALTYTMIMLLCYYGYSKGLASINPVMMFSWFAVAVLFNIGLYALFRSGYNKRFKDPSLTFPQMVAAAFFTLAITYYADAGRGISVLVYATFFTFGMFRLRVRQFIFLTGLTMIGYGIVIIAIAHFKPHLFDPTIDWLSWVVLAAVLTWFSFIGGYVNRLRESFSKANDELSKAIGAIAELVIHDDLTQVFNRRHIFTVLQREKSLCDRDQSAFALCMIDVDHFKEVNDTYGHLAGDMVLKLVAQHIQNNIREVDYLARYGGEEFALVLVSPDFQEALLCAERIRQRCAELSFSGFPDTLKVTISCGVASYNPPESVDELIRRADAALYRAKAKGRNRIESVPVTPF